MSKNESGDSETGLLGGVYGRRDEETHPISEEVCSQFLDCLVEGYSISEIADAYNSSDERVWIHLAGGCDHGANDPERAMEIVLDEHSCGHPSSAGVPCRNGVIPTLDRCRVHLAADSEDEEGGQTDKDPAEAAASTWRPWREA